MTLIELLLVLAVVMVAGLVWWFDLFCFKRLNKHWVSSEACKRFCSSRQDVGCQISPDDAEEKCARRGFHDEAVVKFFSVRKKLEGRGFPRPPDA